MSTVPPAPPSPSPYSAPNTPIASAKRARTGKKEHESVRSPVQSRKLDVDDTQESHTDRVRKTSSASPPVAKTLFSPSLKFGVSVDDDPESPVADTQIEAVQEAPPEERVAIQEVVEESNEEEEEEFNPYLFISSLPPYHSVSPSRHQEAGLPRLTSSQQLTLVLDLDETLVHCTIEPIAKADMVFPVAFNGTYYQVFVRKRPYLDYFLETISKAFEVVVFTASQRVYAEHLLDLLDPQRKLIQHRLFRDSCLCVYGNFIKDLEILNRDLSKTVLVDNSPHAYGYQINNGVPIESWFDDDSDTELLKLIGFLRRLQPSTGSSSSSGLVGGQGSHDVRDTIREHFKTYQLVEKAASGQAVLTTAPPF
eukprot:CAMPEP_0182420328 /NCGR_PEP_ID=MMETSP1167-20130531/5051_1 /TAXON_ID=2988 /ORGANISM="Mallomonas Sp, Strain CCMP3275" /LENGTH=365 /DNA_ID=CAMNT_0024596151 /DNA_START=115 /DNA_END=1212 /DNA_ORIENTATION=-